MSFKEFKKKENIKTWENKLRRLYASENLSDDDLKYLNIQYDLYRMRKNNSNFYRNDCNIIFSICMGFFRRWNSLFISLFERIT